MNNKISSQALATLMAEATGKNRRFCEDFQREFFRIITDALQDGENVRIKSFGSFKIVDVDSRNSVNVSTGERHEIAAHKRVVFTSSKEMATLINAPFELFETVEIDTDYNLNEIKEEVKPVSSNETDKAEDIFEIEDSPVYEENRELEEGNETVLNEQRLEEGSIEENEDDIFTKEAYQALQKEDIAAIKPDPVNSEQENISTSAFKQNESNIEDTQGELYFEEEMEKGKYKKGFFAGAMTSLAVCAIIFMLGCFFGWWPVNFGSVQDLADKNPVNTEEVNEIPVETNTQTEDNNVEKPDEPAVYDTVSTTRYLTTIAREHYGNFNFWPYIYLENESFLGHPDRIKPGTKIVVPSLSKYGIDPQSKEDVEKAKKLSMEIYARFK